MEQRTFVVTAGVVFALVALAHLVRIYFGWPIVISMTPQKMENCWAMSREEKVMPKTMARYLMRSPVSIRQASQIIAPLRGLLPGMHRSGP